MYIYFDQNGTVKEIISDGNFRVGDSKRDKIYVYWEGEHSPISGWIKYRKPNGQYYPESTELCFFEVGDSLVEKQLPTKPLRNLKYFSYDHTYTKNGQQVIGYQFYEIKVPDEVLNGAIENSEEITENNLIIARIRFVMDESELEIKALGSVVFSVETNIGILTDSSINETQYNYLISLISTKVGAGITSVKVTSLPTVGLANTIYYLKSTYSNLIYDAYFWNGTDYVYLGTTSYGLFTEEEADAYKVYMNSLWTNAFDNYKNEINPLIRAATSGSPKGVYASLSALTTDDPNHSYIYVVSDSGHWYYWNGSTWSDGGVYMSSLTDFDGALNEESDNAVQNKVIAPLMPKKTEDFSSSTYTTRIESPIGETIYNGWLIPFSKKFINGKLNSINVTLALSPASQTVKVILMDANKVVLKNTTKVCSNGTAETITLDWDLSEVLTDTFYIGLASNNASDHLMIYQYSSSYPNSDYVSQVTSIETAYSTNGGSTWNWMNNTTNMNYKTLFFIVNGVNYKQAPDKNDVVEKTEMANYSTNDVLGKKDHSTVNLFNVKKLSPDGQWVNFYNGQFEYYPTNPSLEHYCNSDFIEVEKDTDYAYTGGNGTPGWQQNASVVFFDENKQFISGEAGNQWNLPQKVYHTPVNAKYMIINFSERKLAERNVQLEKGSVATAYQPYYGDLYYLENLLVKEDQIETASVSNMIRCADSYDLVVGDTFELFYKGILQVFNYENYNVVCQCDIGSTLTRKFMVNNITSEMVGNHSLAITVFNNEQKQLAQKTITLKVSAKKTSPVSEKVILCMGDSLTQGGQWVDEFSRRLTKTSSQTSWGASAPTGLGLSNITFIGKKTSRSGVRFEGYGGWGFANYLSTSASTSYWITVASHDKTNSDQESIWKDANNVQWQLETIEANRLKFKKYSGNGVMSASGTLTWVSGGVHTSSITFTASSVAEGNPFVYNGQIDFASYCADMGVQTIDEVYILLGWNNATLNEPSMTDCETFIGLLRAFNPSIKVILIGLEIPSLEGCGLNYGAQGIYSRYMELVNYVHNLDDAYKDVAGNYVSGVYSVNLAGQFDTEYNMEFSNTTPNERNPMVISMQSNGVHPGITGCYQIADVAYRWYNGNN